MRVTIRQYSIAGIKLQIECKEIYLQKELRDFLIPVSGDRKKQDCSLESDAENSDIDIKMDVKISIYEEDFTPVLEGKLLLSNGDLSITEYTDFFMVNYLGECSVSCYTVSKVSKKASIFIRKESEKASEKVLKSEMNNEIYESKESKIANMSRDEGNLMTELMYAVRDAFFFYLQQMGRVVVHSASFLYKDKAWLFSASSGTGKSTHVNLWKNAGYEIQDLNGDLAACYVDESGRVMAAGLPWCGTSGIYTNRIVPLGGIFFLKRSPFNKVETMSDVEGILHMIARLTTPNWNKEQAAQNANIVQMIEL